MDPVRYLSQSEIADRIGISPVTIRAMRFRGEPWNNPLPEPDGVIGKGQRAVPGWLPETIDEWLARREQLKGER